MDYVIVDKFDIFNLMGRVRVDPYNFIPMTRHDPNTTGEHKLSA